MQMVADGLSLSAERAVSRRPRISTSTSSHWLDHLEAQGLIHRSADEVGPPPLESNESYRLTLLAQIVMQMLERFFIAVGLLQQAGQNRIDRRTLEYDCIALARRVSRLYGLNAPEFFDARSVPQLRRYVDRTRCPSSVDANGKLGYADVIGEVTRASSVVLPTEFRHWRCCARSRNAKRRAQTDFGRRGTSVNVEPHAASDESASPARPTAASCTAPL